MNYELVITNYVDLTCLLIAAQPTTKNLPTQDQAEIKIVLSLKLDWGIGRIL
ncbi:MAG: hypothetical protein V7L21_04145 [Nostoc sp.]|uniref:hypothetical protein n=1 Tax=Nostoc sp. TaxID=1180 RepID=UPI002FF73175